MKREIHLSRRTLILGSISTAATLAGCATPSPSIRSVPLPEKASRPLLPATDAELEQRYAALEDGGHLIPAIPYREMDPKFYRQRVKDPTGEPPGTVVVDTPDRFLYLVEPGGTAMRYGVGIGREGFAWEGEGVIHWRQHWPRWKPPSDMIARQPHLEKYSVANGGMEPGITNPLGARALYIFQNGKDTLYRLHGSPEWKSIGKAVSSGCVRLVNQDVIDLYQRVPFHARIVVRQDWSKPATTLT
ncbi:L,D-transpeptidase [Rhizobiaceae bacterium n13]|uniref:L,D-transpeptidase n=1 Tax=Ferirhizobium litorale TaxID=2927786 RepID=A0AAE3U2B6_9HYPH|nr:L,D-transpeptidase [Fererhizobium litorale]MDI7860671.1 L,D-transpeptidase [Fererhizobium litorale]MDI7920819.1 L,D-transpeptidase [Fererhizobium litorale]